MANPGIKPTECLPCPLLLRFGDRATYIDLMVDAADPSALPVKVRFEGSVVVPVSPSTAFTIADMAMLSLWNPAVATSRLVDGGSMEVGARYSCTLKRGPVRLTVAPVLVEVVADELVVYAGKFGFAHSIDSIQFRPEGSGTRLTFRNESSLPRWTRPLRWVIAKAFHRQAQRSLEGAARYLSADSRAWSGGSRTAGPHSRETLIEAAVGIEPTSRVLQTLA